MKRWMNTQHHIRLTVNDFKILIVLFSYKTNITHKKTEDEYISVCESQERQKDSTD